MREGARPGHARQRWRDRDQLEPARRARLAGPPKGCRVNGSDAYTVFFDRSLPNCVVDAQPGSGDPTGTAASFGDATREITMNSGGTHNQVSVEFRQADVTNAPDVDTSCMITAFC
jgi:hypothetical protein